VLGGSAMSIFANVVLLVLWAAVATEVRAAGAQSQPVAVTGVVIDDRTEQPITGVLVYLEGQPTVAETDAEGRFRVMAPSGRQTIIASIIGYALLSTDVEIVAAPIVMTIRLSEGAGAYTEKVTVSGSLRAESDSLPGSTSLHGRELETLRGAVLDDPLRAVQALPAVTATDDFYSEFAVRGNPFRYVGMNVDGVPTRYLMHAVNGITDGGSVAMINSDTLGSVSLLPGSYPQRTGRHMGGQFDLATREGARDGFHGRAGLSGTSAHFLGEGPLAGGKGSWLASIRRSYLDYLIKRIDPEAGFAFGFVDAQARVTYDLGPRHQLSVTALLGRAVFDEEEPDLDENDIRKGISRAWLTTFSWRYLPNPRFAMTQRIYFTGLRYNNDNDAGASLDSARFAEFGWRADASYSLTPRLVMEFGGDSEDLSGRNHVVEYASAPGGQQTLTDYDENAGAASAYGQVRISLGSRLSLTPGARIDYWSLTDSTFASPWLNAAWRLTDGTRLLGGTGIYRQFPSLEDVLGVHGGGRDLRPEKALHGDAGLEHSLPHQTRLLFNVYARREEDVLRAHGAEPRVSDGRIRPESAVAPLVNALTGTARGIEVVLRRETASGFSGWAGYGYGRLQYEDGVTGERFWADFDQRHTVTLYGNYRLSSKASVSARYRYGANYPMAGYIAEAVPPAPGDEGRRAYYALSDSRNQIRLPAYSRLDLRADRAFKWGNRRIVAFVDVANIVDHENLRNTPYFVDRFGRVFGPTETLMPIVPSGGLVVEF
jgi:hypothetical protein